MTTPRLHDPMPLENKRSGFLHCGRILNNLGATLGESQSLFLADVLKSFPRFKLAQSESASTRCHETRRTKESTKESCGHNCAFATRVGKPISQHFNNQDSFQAV